LGKGGKFLKTHSMERKRPDPTGKGGRGAGEKRKKRYSLAKRGRELQVMHLLGNGDYRD